MKHVELEAVINLNPDKLFWVRFNHAPDQKGLILSDHLLFSFVHQTTLKFYYEVSFVCRPESVLSIQPAEICASEATLTGCTQAEYEQLRSDPLYMPQA